MESARHVYMNFHLCFGQAAERQWPSLQQRKRYRCLTATEVTIDRHASKELSIPQLDWHETFVTAVLWITKFFTTLNHMMVYSVLHFVLKWQKYFCQQWLLVPCCVQCWSLANPHAAAQHAGESTKVNVFWVISSHKVLSFHRIGNYRHSQHDAMEVWMMSHVGQEDRITFFFKQNCPVSYFYQCGWISQQSFPTEVKWQTGRATVELQAPRSDLIILLFLWDNVGDIPCTWCLRILISPISTLRLAVNQKTHKWCPVFGMRMITIFVCHQY